MAEDAGIGVLGGEGLQQLVEGVLLGLGASVGRMAVLIKTALIDYAQRTVVVMTGMDALDGLGQQRDDIAIAADIIMVRALTILGLAAGDEVLDTEGAVALCSCTVNHQQFQRIMFQGLHFSNTNFTNKTNFTELRKHELEPVGSARLNGHGAEDRGDDCCEEFKDFSNVGPVYFDHIQIF